jgi:hypothetical protein
MRLYIFHNLLLLIGKSIGLIAEAVSSRSSKEDNNLIVFLESERMRAEERERIRQEERSDERRREDHRFQMQMQMMMMMMMNSNRLNAPGHLTTPSLTQASVQSSPEPAPQFDGQDFLERELLKRTTGV